MKPTALFVNTSRAELVARNAGVGAQPRPARHGRGRRVRERAHPAGPPAAAAGERICTPHIGYVEQDSYELYFGAAFDNVINFLNGSADQHRQPGATRS
jgi:D-3-phosphoglycerate dehydrogenase